jgi:hypothetical protein
MAEMIATDGYLEDTTNHEELHPVLSKKCSLMGKMKGSAIY